MSWTLFAQVVMLIVAVGAVVDSWIKTSRQKLPSRGMRFIDPKGEERS